MHVALGVFISQTLSILCSVLVICLIFRGLRHEVSDFDYFTFIKIINFLHKILEFIDSVFEYIDTWWRRWTGASFISIGRAFQCSTTLFEKLNFPIQFLLNLSLNFKPWYLVLYSFQREVIFVHLNHRYHGIFYIIYLNRITP